MKKFSLLLLSVLMALSFVACGDDDDVVGNVSFTDNPNSTLKVSHQDNTDVVLFKAAPGAGPGIGVMLGGVRGLAQAWGVPNVSTADGLFVMNIVTVQDYQANASNPRVAASILVYVDNVPATYAISSSLVGDGSLRFYNQSENYVEIRKDSYYSAPLTVLRPLETKLMYLPTGDYDLFPIMKVERRSGPVLVGLVEKKLNDLVNSYSFVGGNTQTITIPASGGIQLEHTVAYLRVQNNSSYGLRMRAGNTIIPNSLNREVVNGGGSSEYGVTIIGETQTFSYNFVKTMGEEFATIGTAALTKGRVYVLTIPETGGTGSVTLTDQGAYETVYPTNP